MRPDLCSVIKASQLSVARTTTRLDRTSGAHDGCRFERTVKMTTIRRRLTMPKPRITVIQLGGDPDLVVKHPQCAGTLPSISDATSRAVAQKKNKAATRAAYCRLGGTTSAPPTISSTDGTTLATRGTSTLGMAPEP